MLYNIPEGFTMNNIAKIILSTIATVIIFYGLLLLLPKSNITYLADDAIKGVDLIEVKLESANFVRAIWSDGNPCLQGSIGKCNQ